MGLLERSNANGSMKTTSPSSMKSLSKHGETMSRCWKLQCPNLHSLSTVARVSHSTATMVAIHSRAHLPSKVLVATIHRVRTTLHQVTCIPCGTLCLTYKDRPSHSKATISTSKWAAAVLICRSSTTISAAATTISISGPS